MMLNQICEKIAAVVDDLMLNDDISVSFKADILDDILAIIGLDVAEGVEPELEKVELMLSKLIEFQEAYEIDLGDPIKNLQEYISGE